MQIYTNLDLGDEDNLEKYRPADDSVRWVLVASGFWSEDMSDSGYIAYYLTATRSGTWVMDGVERNAELDYVTQEDVDKRRLTNAQLESLREISLKEAQNYRHRRIVAVAEGVDPEARPEDVARALYNEIWKAGGKIIDDSDADGLLDI